MTTFSLNTKAIKKGIKMYCGIDALVRNYKGNTISVLVKSRDKADMAKVENFFLEFSIKMIRCDRQIVKPFFGNVGEYNSLIGVNED